MFSHVSGGLYKRTVESEFNTIYLERSTNTPFFCQAARVGAAVHQLHLAFATALV